MRLSGPDAPAISARLIERVSPFRPRHATLGTVRAADAEAGRGAIDHVVVTWFQAPSSYTGEDVVEIGAHGSPVVLKAIVERSLQEGARLAEPGEFTFRAYLHGRIDLVQAEAVADLIDAVTPLQARAAVDQLDGTLTRAIGAIDTGLFDLCARLEASLDFPEEGYHFITRETASEELDTIDRQLEGLARDGRRGRLIREGVTVVIAGRPNVGKSSLFNALAGVDRAIVTDLPGTTRDVLTERIDLDGMLVTLVDTAGLRETADVVEAEGVRRARDAQRSARLVLMILDGSAPLDEDDRLWVGSGQMRRVVVVSKSDLPTTWALDPQSTGGVPTVRVSVRTGEGVGELRRAIVRALTGEEARSDAPAISNVRHLALVDRGREAVSLARKALAAGATEELVLAELVAAREALESITGRRTPDELLNHIFGRFCVGK